MVLLHLELLLLDKLQLDLLLHSLLGNLELLANLPEVVLLRLLLEVQVTHDNLLLLCPHLLLIIKLLNLLIDIGLERGLLEPIVEILPENIGFLLRFQGLAGCEIVVILGLKAL